MKKMYNQPIVEAVEVTPMHSLLDVSVNENGGGGGTAGAPQPRGEAIH